jgi:hypothetical protein
MPFFGQRGRLAGTLVVSPGACSPPEETRCTLMTASCQRFCRKEPSPKRNGWSQGALTEEEWVVVRDSLGATRDYALRVSLADTLPRTELSSTGFCLANVGSEYLVYQQESEVFSVDVDLSDAPRTRRFLVEWADLSRDFKRRNDGVVNGGGTAQLTPPWGPKRRDSHQIRAATTSQGPRNAHPGRSSRRRG